MAQTGLGLAMWLRLSWDWLCGSNWPGIGYVAQIVMGLAVWLRLAWDWLCGSDCSGIGCRGLVGRRQDGKLVPLEILESIKVSVDKCTARLSKSLQRVCGIGEEL